LTAERMELKVEDSFECPEGHKATIVWISEDKKVIAVRCSQKHLKKVVKVTDDSKTALRSRHQPRKERKIYVRNMVFLMKSSKVRALNSTTPRI